MASNSSVKRKRSASLQESSPTKVKCDDLIWYIHVVYVHLIHVLFLYALRVVRTNWGHVRPVARGLYLGNKMAYKHTACCNLAFVWTAKHKYKFMNLPCPQAEQSSYALHRWDFHSDWSFKIRINYWWLHQLASFPGAEEEEKSTSFTLFVHVPNYSTGHGRRN